MSLSDPLIVDCARDLVRNGSIELSSGRKASIESAASRLPFGTAVFLPMHRGFDVDSYCELLTALRQAGLEPVPHLSARSLRDAAQLDDLLGRATGDAGVHRALLIGGDHEEASGPFADSLELLRKGIRPEHGISEILVSGFPEGHPRLPVDEIDRRLDEKRRLAEQRGLGITVLSQFSLSPGRVLDYCAHLERRHPGLGLYLGLAGPAPDARLMHYARRCGVSASLIALEDFGMDAETLNVHPQPDEQLAVFARHCAHDPDSCVIGIHVFSFGGMGEAADWMALRLSSGP